VIDNLSKFIEIFIQPVVDGSKIEKDRSLIRQCRPLNQLLDENAISIQQLFRYYEGYDGFTIEKANILINENHKSANKGAPELLDYTTLKKLFHYSQMVVMDESKQ